MHVIFDCTSMQCVYTCQHFKLAPFNGLCSYSTLYDKNEKYKYKVLWHGICVFIITFLKIKKTKSQSKYEQIKIKPKRNIKKL